LPDFHVVGLGVSDGRGREREVRELHQLLVQGSVRRRHFADGVISRVRELSQRALEEFEQFGGRPLSERSRVVVPSDGQESHRSRVFENVTRVEATLRGAALERTKRFRGGVQLGTEVVRFRLRITAVTVQSEDIVDECQGCRIRAPPERVADGIRVLADQPDVKDGSSPRSGRCGRKASSNLIVESTDSLSLGEG
jgi:hypothetical protein